MRVPSLLGCADQVFCLSSCEAWSRGGVVQSGVMLSLRCSDRGCDGAEKSASNTALVSTFACQTVWCGRLLGLL